MSILQDIAQFKVLEVKKSKQEKSIDDLCLEPLFLQDRLRLKDCFSSHEDVAIIAEFKRKSPSVSAINLEIPVRKVIKAYDDHNALAMSVLTDSNYFGGSSEDLKEAAKLTSRPLLRKDFVVNEYQIYEAKAMGASIVLLIAAILSKEQILTFAVKAKELNMDVLLEVHDREEIKNYNEYVSAIGVNNRNLKTFKVDYKQSKELYKYLPKDVLKISESGLKKSEDVAELKELGFDAFLIGERFMKYKNPGQELGFFKQSVLDLL